MKKLIILFLSLGILVEAVAQDTGPVEANSFFMDQDFLPALGNSSDKNYTMGLGLKYSNTTFFNSGLSQALWKADYWLKRTFIGNDETDDSIPIGSGFYMLSGNGFTPNNINTSEIQYNDRPYSSLIALTFATSKLSNILLSEQGVPKVSNLEVSFGVIGSGVSAQVQTKIHQLMNDGDTKSPFTPKGWRNQISNGGEPTLLVLRKDKYLVLSLNRDLKPKLKESEESQSIRLLDFTVGHEQFVGYYTGAALTAGGRIGILDYRNWQNSSYPLTNIASFYAKLNKLKNLQKQIGADSQLLNAAASRVVLDSLSKEINELEKYQNGYYEKKRKFEIYFASELRPTMMLYNALLEGQFRNSVYTISGHKTNPFFYSFVNSANINVPFRKSNLTLTYNFFSYRSAEFKQKGYSGQSHTWGGAYITFSSFII